MNFTSSQWSTRWRLRFWTDDSNEAQWNTSPCAILTGTLASPKIALIESVAELRQLLSQRKTFDSKSHKLGRPSNLSVDNSREFDLRLTATRPLRLPRRSSTTTGSMNHRHFVSRVTLCSWALFRIKGTRSERDDVSLTILNANWIYLFVLSEWSTRVTRSDATYEWPTRVIRFDATYL